MSDHAIGQAPAGSRGVHPPEGATVPTPLAAQYALALLMTALAAVLAFVVENLISAPNLTLIFVLPVVIAATAFGWGPSLAAAAAGALAFDFFFTEPRYSFRIASASDIWAAALLLVVAAVVSAVAAESRRRALEARRAAEQASALQALAHAVIADGSTAALTSEAATALNRIFRAPAVILSGEKGALRVLGRAGDPALDPAAEDAARGVLASNVAARGETYPYDQSHFDFWPINTAQGRLALGVDFTQAASGRPEAPQRLVEIVGGYLVTAAAR